MLDPDTPASDDETDVSLSEAAQAVMDVLAECHGNLEAMRRRSDGEGLEVDIDPSELLNLREQVFHAAVRDRPRYVPFFAYSPNS